MNKIILISSVLLVLLASCTRYVTPEEAASRPQKCGRGGVN